MKRVDVVRSSDVALLRAIAGERSVVRASRRVGMSRDRAVYRLHRLARAFGGPVVAGVRGGSEHGASLLTPLGDRIVRGGFGAVELLDAGTAASISRPNLLHGTYRRRPSPRVDLGEGVELRVAFPAEDGAPVTLLLDPEAILVARRRFPTSARNRLRATVERCTAGPGALERTLLARAGPLRLRVAVTEEPVRQLGLRRGATVWLYVKATSLRRVGSPGTAARSRRARRRASRGPLRS